MNHTGTGPRKEIIFLYGPPGSGKTTIGKHLAQRLALPFVDLDQRIEELIGKSIPQVFAEQGESGFRNQESAFLCDLLNTDRAVVALGGGTLLNPHNREFVEGLGSVVLLHATNQVLLERLYSSPVERPLLFGDTDSRLSALLDQRASHYDSFPLKMDVSEKGVEETIWEIQVALGMFRISGMNNPYDVRVGHGLYQNAGGQLAARGLKGPIAIVSDEKVGAIYGRSVLSALHQQGFAVNLLMLPTGEKTKNLGMLKRIWNFFLDNRLDRDGIALALGGGVIGDITGLAAATYLRGIKWVYLPTSLLAMCDACLGGKTGINLPNGKNQIGAFYPPSMVLADTDTLSTLTNFEIRNGMAEVVKHGIIADPDLYQYCGAGLEIVYGNWDKVVRQAMAVKIRIILDDPYERGMRAVLNLGHTLGHAIESATHYRTKHGYAISIGMVAAANLSERIGLANAGITGNIQKTLQTLGLPTKIPRHLDREKILASMSFDKKQAFGNVRLVLPVRIGDVKWGVEVDDLKSLMSET